jgi:hypothetical protein
MPKLTMVESQSIAELADSLYSFLPASFSAITWPSVAESLGVRECWPDINSKTQAIPIFLRNLLEHRRGRFCDTILRVIQEGLTYRLRKGNPVTREELETINGLLRKVQFQIPELHERAFLDGLPSSSESPADTTDPAAPNVSRQTIDTLRSKFLTLCTEPDERKRGFDFERFLTEFFSAFGLDPRGSFRVNGEQIDGSFEWQRDVFMVEARWRKTPANAADLYVLHGKAEKSEWTRGLFISINGFSDLASPTFSVGRKANLIAMSGQDLILILEQRWTLPDALRRKLRHTGETAEVFKPLHELTN